VIEAGTQALWEAYGTSRSSGAKRDLVVQYLDLVRYVAHRLGKPTTITGRTLELEDMIQFGVFGLMSAIERFSPETGVKFETYAIPRIRGAILDELRNLDWVPRSVRANAKKVETAVERMSQTLGRDAVEEELAQALNMTIDDLQHMIDEAKLARNADPAFSRSAIESREDAVEEEPNALEQISDEETRKVLVEAIAALPDRNRTVIALYYYEGLKFNEIARILRVSESRISQIHSEVLKELRKSLQAQN
jgi:RNA polymerase sigma factor for flagellar operon FliA